MKYKAYLTQEGEGCDYTIGCAQTVIDIHANNIGDAKQKLIEIIEEDYNCFEYSLSGAEIYECNQIHIMPIKEIYNEIDAKEMEREQKRIEEEELKQYLKLKEKFEK